MLAARRAGVIEARCSHVAGHGRSRQDGNIAASKD